MNYLAMIPAIISVVKAIENLMPDAGKGAEKLAAARTMLEELYGDLSGNWESIAKVIALFVKLANATGLFKKG